MIVQSNTASRRERLIDGLPIGIGAVLALLALALAGCGGQPDADAFGNFEATDVTVSAESEGRLVSFSVDEGDVLTVGQTVGLVDTTQLAAQRDALEAQRLNLLGQKQSLLVQSRATRAQAAEADAGAGVVAAQLATAEEELARTERLFESGAATARERNERQGAVRALREQLEQARARRTALGAQSDVPTTQAEAIDGQVAAIDAQLRQVRDRIEKARVTNPVAGTVLAVIAREGETVRPGSPLYSIADLSALRLRAYATGDQLPLLRVGMPVDVQVDDGRGGLQAVRGEVVAVASAAEFTPTPIQTRDERADLVYAFLVRVPNADGRLKVGMPGEVVFLEPDA